MISIRVLLITTNNNTMSALWYHEGENKWFFHSFCILGFCYKFLKKSFQISISPT